MRLYCVILSSSHPLGVRELKPLGHVARGLAGWSSHPLGVRELKRECGGGGDVGEGSHPLGVRELKLGSRVVLPWGKDVAPFRGA